MTEPDNTETRQADAARVVGMSGAATNDHGQPPADTEHASVAKSTYLEGLVLRQRDRIEAAEAETERLRQAMERLGELADSEPLIVSGIRSDLARTPNGRGGELRLLPATPGRGKSGCPGDNVTRWFDDLHGILRAALAAVGRPSDGERLPTLIGLPWTDADAEDMAEVQHAALHAGTFVPSWRSCPEHRPSDGEGATSEAPWGETFRDALTLHLWDEGWIRPESFGRQVVDAVAEWVTENSPASPVVAAEPEGGGERG